MTKKPRHARLRKTLAKKHAKDLRGWNFDLSQMPADGRFEALRLAPEVYRHDGDSNWVIDPVTGAMFIARAWRPARA